MVVDATMADVSSPVIASVSRTLDGVDGRDVDLDVPPKPPGARWELQVHVRPVAAGADPEEHPRVRVGDAVTTTALPVSDDDLRLEAAVRIVTS